MKPISNTLLGVSMAVGAFVAAVGVTVHTGDVGAYIQAAPVHSNPSPPSPPPPSPPSQVQGDNSNPNPNPGADGGGGGGGG